MSGRPRSNGSTAGGSQKDFGARFGKPRLWIARMLGEGFLPGDWKSSSRVEEVALLIREALLRGIRIPQMGRVVATSTGGAVSAQTASKLRRDPKRIMLREWMRIGTARTGWWRERLILLAD
jgi:hypothetical protein